MATAVPSSFQKLVECPGCFKLYKEPQLLKCQHHVCHACVQRIVQHELVACPECGVCSLLDSIKADFNKTSLVEAFVKDKEERGRKTDTGGVSSGSELYTLLKPDFCESCKKGVNVSSQCDSCSVFLCADCQKRHSHGAEHHTLKPVCSIVDSLKSDISKTLESLAGCSQVVESELKAGEKYLEGIENIWNKTSEQVDQQVTDFINLIKYQNAVSLEETRMKLQEFTKTQLQKKSNLKQIKSAISKKLNALKYVVAELEQHNENDIRTAVCKIKNVYYRIKSDTLILKDELQKITEMRTQTLPIFKLKPPVTSHEAIEWQVEVNGCEHPATVNQEETAELNISLSSHDAKCDDSLQSETPNVEPSLPMDTRFEGNMIEAESKGLQQRGPAGAEISHSAQTASGEGKGLNSPMTTSAENELENATATTTDENGNPTTNDGESNEASNNKCHTKIKEIDRNSLKPGRIFCSLEEHNRIIRFQDELWCTKNNKNILDIYDLDCVFLRNLKLQHACGLRALVHSSSGNRIFAASVMGLHEYKRNGKRLSCLSRESFIDVTKHETMLYAMETENGNVCVFDSKENVQSNCSGQHVSYSWTMIRKINLGNYIGDAFDRLHIIHPIAEQQSRAFLVTSWYNHKIYQFHFVSGDLVSSEGNDSCWYRMYKKNNDESCYHDFSLLKPQIECGDELDALSRKRWNAIIDVAVNDSGNLVWLLTEKKLVKYRYA